MIELTLEQHQAMASTKEAPLRAIDPQTRTTYVLVREEIYDRMKSLLREEDDDQFVHALFQDTMRVFGRDGWDDPAMDVYNDLDPRKQP